MKKLNGHFIFIAICVVISLLFGIAEQDFDFGICMFVMTCGNGYFYYLIFRLFTRNTNDPRKQLLKEQERLRYTAVNATLIESGTTYKTKGGLGGAIVGGALFGPIGSLIGSASTQTIEPKTVQFLVEYKDGHTVIEDVKVNSLRYKQLIKYMTF